MTWSLLCDTHEICYYISVPDHGQIICSMIDPCSRYYYLDSRQRTLNKVITGLSNSLPGTGTVITTSAQSGAAKYIKLAIELAGHISILAQYSGGLYFPTVCPQCGWFVALSGRAIYAKAALHLRENRSTVSCTDCAHIIGLNKNIDQRESGATYCTYCREGFPVDPPIFGLKSVIVPS